jgi:outer membrane protein assembly factor BamB
MLRGTTKAHGPALRWIILTTPSWFHLMRLHTRSILFSTLLSFVAMGCPAADWPMWRYDAGRTAASEEKLPVELHLEWERRFTPRVQVWDDPLNHDLMTYDKVFEPVVAGDRMFIGFNDSDKVVALDLATGKEAWAFYTDGPVRLAPVAWKGKVYFASDDGSLYCVSAAEGKLLWSFRGGPSARKALGNGRIVSAWPARGGPVIRDGRVYFAASIWPFMGTFLYSLDAESGKVVWVNDGTGAQFMKQPHSAPAFAGVAPQGALVATEKMLLVPGGRSVPACFDRETGELKYFHLNDGGKGNGGSFVAAGESNYYVHTRVRSVRTYDLKSGTASRSTCNEPVITAGEIYSAAETSKGEPVVRALGTGEKIHWEIAADASGDLIKAGDHLYAAGKGTLTAIALPKGDAGPRFAWSKPIEGDVQRLLAANGKLIAVTLDGRIMVHGSSKPQPPETKSPATLVPSPAAAARVQRLLTMCDSMIGHVLCYDATDLDLIDALVTNSSAKIAIVISDTMRVEELRRRYDAAGHYGTRVSVHHGDAASFMAPNYIASLTIGPRSVDQASLKTLYTSVRPYGGVLYLPASTRSGAQTLAIGAGLQKAAIKEFDDQCVVVREGALPGAADWTHQYGDIANTVKSDDGIVKAPLGVLWFGGSSNVDVLPRHGHGPPEQVIGGRLFIEGMNSISARDVYTGQILWKTDFGDLGTFGIYYNETYADTPLSTSYNQKHIPGANGRGTNFVATMDSVYVAVHGECHTLDARTGALKQKMALRSDGTQAEWGYIGVYEDILLGGDGYAHYTLKLGTSAKSTAPPIEDYSASDGLAAFDRHSGKVLWRIKAKHSFLHNGIVAGNGRIYCLDKLADSAEGLLKRRGIDVPADYRIVALDARTGNVVWEQRGDIFGTWLGYSKEHDTLLQAGAKAKDRLSGEVGDGMIAYQGRDGRIKWKDLEHKYTGPCILHNSLIFTGANSYESSSGVTNLEDGTPHMVPNPLTGKLEPWRINRAYGCNTMIASENLLTFRSGAAGYYDLESKSGSGNLGGFRSGCTSNLVVANGVLNAPDYTRTCTCGYQNQTSLALVHMPEMDIWAYSQFGLDGNEGDRIHRVGINFGAPGDRRAEDGTLWLEYPDTGEGISPGLGIQVTGGKSRYFRRHSSQVTGDGLGWVASSGLADAETIIITPTLTKPVMKKSSSSKDKDKGKDEDEGRKEDKVKDKSKGDAKQKVTALVPKVSHPPMPYTVRLHFAEPDDQPPGARVFSIALQDKPVLGNFDIHKAAGGAGRIVVKEFPHVSIGDDLVIRLTPAADAKSGPVLCGVELIAEQKTAEAPSTVPR